MILVDLGLRATGILLVALVTTVLLRRGAAATRHLVWTLAVAGVLALPVLGAVLPDWTILPSPGRIVNVNGVSDRLPRLAALKGCATLPTAADGVAPVCGSRDPSLCGAGLQPCPPERSDNARAIFGAGDAGGPRFGAVRRETVANAAVAVWLLVAAVMLVRIAAGIAAVRRIGRHARPADARARAILDEIVQRTGIGAPIRLLVSRDISTPMTWGGRHPLLLMPHEARAWCEDRIRMALLHEVAHIRRADWLSHLAARVALACHWFNPLAWVAVRAMTRERERACDDYVVLQGSPAADYAQHLLDIARAGVAGPGWAVAPAMARRSEIEGRLLSILTPHRREFSRGTPVGLTIAAVAAAVCIAAAAPAPAAGPSVPPPQRPVPAPHPSPPAVAAAAAERENARQARSARKAIREAMHDTSADVREKAALALALQSGDEVLEPLLGALRDPSAQVREKAALGLAFRRQPAVVDALLEAVGDSDAQVREKVVFALGVSGDPRALPALAAAAKDPDPQVREKAVQGLALASSGADSLVDSDLIRDAVRGGLAGAISALARR